MEEDYYFPSRLPPPRCAVCASTTGSLRCGGCRVISYCGATHQSDHRSRHKAACTAIRKSREALQTEETALRNHPADSFSVPADVFNTGVGRFWGLVGTRDYMRARFKAADALLRVDTKPAVETALGHFTDMLRLCRTDNLGVRDIVPNLLLRLGREQECYDFIKWWATIDDKDHYNGRYDWGDVTLPYLDMRDADAFEPIDLFCENHLSLSHLVALTLLKLRLWLDLSPLNEDEDELLYDFGHRPSLPDLHRPVGWLVRAKLQDPDRPEISGMVEVLEAQYQTLSRVVHDANPYFWETLVDESEDPVPPSSYSAGSLEEANLVLYQCKSAWQETEDAILMIDSETWRSTEVYRGPTTPTVADRPEIRSQRNDGRRRVVALCLEQEYLFDAVHGKLASDLSSRATTERATTQEAALDMLAREPGPDIILVADGAITRQKRVCERVMDCLHRGATVVLAGCFSSFVNSGQLNRFFAKLGLAWEQGSYERSTVRLRTGVVSGHLTRGLPAKHNQKALHLKNVEASAAWYTQVNAPGEAAVVFAEIGRGRLGYVGDVNAESGEMVLAMCGLLG